MSASVMQVFHQEMATYYLRPSFEYQDLPSKFVGMIDSCPFKFLGNLFRYQWKLTFGRRAENPSRTKSLDGSFTSSRLQGNLVCEEKDTKTEKEKSTTSTRNIYKFIGFFLSIFSVSFQECVLWNLNLLWKFFSVHIARRERLHWIDIYWGLKSNIMLIS